MTTATIAPRNRRVMTTSPIANDYDAVMKRAHERAMQQDSYTPEEAYNLIMKEIKAVYDGTPIL